MTTVTGASTPKIAPRATAATQSTNQRMRANGTQGFASNGLRAGASHTAKNQALDHAPKNAKQKPIEKSAHPYLKRIVLNSVPLCWTQKTTTPVWALVTRQPTFVPKKMLEISTKFVMKSAWQIHQMSTMQTASTTTELAATCHALNR